VTLDPRRRDARPVERIVILAAVACWVVLAIVWVAAAVRAGARSAVAGETRARRRARAAPIVAMLLVVGALSLAGTLTDEEIPAGVTIASSWLQPIGLVLLAGSTALAVWARLVLGTSWSVGPRLAGDGRLRTSGPYGVTRHPIYTGILGMLIGTALISGMAASILVVLAAVVFMEIKIRREERLLLASFPDEYPRYRQRVPQLVPGLVALHR
jgi:protein-S-isoprenylcysteine O-methyltransferase Ste14